MAQWSTLMVMESQADRGPDISLVVPVYNEIDNIDALIDRVRATLDGMGLTWEFLAVDDGSTDGSGELLDDMSRDDERLRVLHFQENRGQSAGLDAGFRNARGRLVALLDADLQTYPEDLPKLIEMLESEELDAVVGIRAERHDTGWKRFSSRFANGVRNWLTREDVQDTGCPIKVFRAEAIRSVKIFTGMHRFLPTLLRMEGFTVKQIPVRHAQRTAGTSKYGTWDRAFSGLRDALAVRWMQDRRMKWKLR
jgi:glycosyltransferase involved in cell wall biosynthesis